ncbi:hypothetical protein [Gorillibacterium sp. CAU 1737]|uniref:hypothetical protein n=1 Tax=Gorillibacterium sp. CAU 1737 TaxID=3140362 RepID=UPI003261B96A
MKEAVKIIDTNGYLLRDLNEPIYEANLTPIYETSNGENQESLLVGYRAAVPVTPGLFRPRFDFTAWNVHQSVLEKARKDFMEAVEQWSSKNVNTRGKTPVFTPPETPVFWIESMTSEEFQAIKVDQKPTELEMLKASNDVLQLAIAELTVLLMTKGGVAP